MRLEPFSKANSIAMLNTLYPPATAAPPTRLLTPHILATQRNAFFRYITGVEQNGKHILKNLEHQGERPGDPNGWAGVRDVVDKYLRTANGVIEESLEVTGPEDFSREAESFRRTARRTDSAVSFSSGERPSTSSSSHSKTSLPTTDKPLPASPPSLNKSYTIPQPTQKRRGTTLERIAREFRNLRNRNDVKEISHNLPLNTDLDYTTRTPAKDTNRPRGLRKMKSTSSIGKETKKFQHSRSGSDEPMPDLDLDARRKQMLLEARRGEGAEGAPGKESEWCGSRKIGWEL